MVELKKIPRSQVIELIADCRLKTNNDETLFLLLEIEEKDYQKMSLAEIRFALIETLIWTYGLIKA